MNRRVFVFRPEPGFAATIAAGQALGLNMAGAPLFAIEPCDWHVPDPASFDGVLLGSANAIRHGGTQLQRLTHLPAYVVGETTAAAARAAGFAIAMVGRGGLQGLLNDLPREPSHLLRLAGADRVPLRLPPAVSLDMRVVYRSCARPLDAEVVAQLSLGSIVLLHSARAATRFAEECRRLSLDTAAFHLATIGRRIDETLAALPQSAPPVRWASIQHAREPTDAALLALAQQMCRTLG